MTVSSDLAEGRTGLQKWAHEFAADGVRPAAAGYHARDGFPPEVLREAAKIGLSSTEGDATTCTRWRLGDPAAGHRPHGLRRPPLR